MLEFVQNKNKQKRNRLFTLLILAMVVFLSVNVDFDEQIVLNDNIVETSAQILSTASFGKTPTFELAEISNRQQVILKGDESHQILNRKNSMLYGGVPVLLIQFCFCAVVIQYSFKFILHARRIIVTYIHNTDGMKSLI